MARRRPWFAVAALGALVRLAAAADEKPPFVPQPIVSSPAPAMAPVAGGSARADLVVPEAVWAAAVEGLGLPPGTVVGYTSEQMASYGRDQRITPPDVDDVPRRPRGAARVGQARRRPPRGGQGPERGGPHGARAHGRGRGAHAAAPRGRRVGPGLAAGDDAARGRARGGAREAGRTRAAARFAPLDDDQRKAWRALPEALQRFVVRVLVGSCEALPWLRAAFDEPFLVAALGARGPAGLASRDLYRLAARPWTDEDETQTATLSRASFEALGRVDRDYLAYASVVHTMHLSVALAGWEAARATVDLAKVEGAALRVDTPVGAVRVLGPSDDAVTGADGPALLVLDLGGKDTYTGRIAVPSYPAAPISTWVDLAGDDTWDGGDVAATMGCGLFGLGVLVDLGGDDKYTVKESGLGCAWYGTGLLLDAAGKDAYVVKSKWGQGAAHVGAGVLLDLAGDDAYECGHQSQGLGSTYGAGLLLDVAGNDAYVARDDGNKEKIYNDQSVAMAQGCGYGRRADLGDGHSLAGGWGVLVDGAGNDRYHAQCWAQGCGYWWAVGVLEDLGGDDVYENGKYSLGAAAHFAVGCHVDLAGDDAYNQGVTTAVNQHQGHARDGSIGVSIDGDGNDRYQLRNMCGGAADLNSIGLFWDRRGDDAYTVWWSQTAAPNGWAETPPMGTASRYEPFRSFRDDLGSWGVFLDTGGKDTWTWKDLPSDAKLYPVGVPFGADGTRWVSRPGGRSAGVGLDVEAVSPRASAPPKPN